jgi:acyl dehydratase
VSALTAASLTVGDVVAERSVHLTREALVRYAGASGTSTRSTTATTSRPRWLPGVLAHGMLTMGLAVETIVPWLGDAGRIVEYGVRFTRPVVVDAEEGADLHVVATVGALTDAEARIDLTVTAAETTVLGKAQVRVRLDG